MISLTLEEIKAYDVESLKIVMPKHLMDTLIGDEIEGTNFYKVREGDPTKSGYYLLENGNKIYKTEHQPTSSKIRYRKINTIGFGDCWEVIPESKGGD